MTSVFSPGSHTSVTPESPLCGYILRNLSVIFMRVLKATSSYYPIIGGAESVVRNLSVELNKARALCTCGV